MKHFDSQSVSIICLGMGWFPITPGGLNRYVYELTHQLAMDGNLVELCGVGLIEKSSEKDLGLEADITFTNLAAPEDRILQRLWKVRSSFRSHIIKSHIAAKPQAINLHFALYSFPLLSSLPKDIPITFTFHGPWAAESAQEGQHPWSIAFKRWLEQRVYRRCDRFIVLSKAFGTILHETYRVPWEQIHIIPGGVNVKRFKPDLSRQDARQKLDWAMDRKILFTPRRLVHRMGLDKLLTAMVQVKQQVPEVWLAIAGKGPMRTELQGQIEALELQNHVRLLGYVPEDLLPVAYQAADMTVVPSQSLEGFGLILVESLACGTPALCTPVGGMPEVVSPFCPDLVTRSLDAAAISDQIIALLSDRLSLPTRAACTDYARTHFDWQAIAPRVRQVLLAK